MSQFFKDIDIFGTEVPTFNMKGRAKVKTLCGACVTILIFILTLAFALVKIDHLAQRKNPSLVSNTSPLEASTKFSTNSDDFMVAFAATRKDGKALHDPQYVRWLAKFRQKANGSESDTFKLLHPCTEEELTRLDPPENEKLAEETKMKQNGGHLFCIDWTQYSHELFGYWRNRDNLSFVDVMLVPCASTEAEADECVWD